MRIPVRLTLVVVLILAAAPPLLAQGRCVPSDTIAKCYDRYLAPAFVQKAKEQQKEELNHEPAGIDTGGFNLATNKKNLIPLLAFSGLLGNSTDEKTRTITFDLNFLLPILGPQGARNAQLQAVVATEPEISPLVKNALPAADRDDLVGQLEDRLGDLSDYSIVFTYNHASRFYGRGFAQYAKRFDALTSPITKKFFPSSGSAPIDDLIEKFPDAFPEDAEDAVFEKLPAEIADEALARVEADAMSIAAFEKDATQALGAAGLARFHQLLDNQPQINVTANKRFRDSLIGPEELSLKVTYEWTSMNFNRSMSRDCHRDLDGDQPAGDIAECLQQYTAFVTKNQDAIARGNRFSFTGEYVDIDEDTIDPGLDGVAPVFLDSATRLTLIAGWSRDFFFGGEPVAMDLVAEYRDFSDDLLRQDRGVASLTFTRQFNGVAVPFGIVYATRGEYLPEVDSRLSAHIGLRYNLFGRDSKRNP
ncbi:MAG TPA: hypothetical protein VF789_29300 [Thermoanaerobaculia bacterium]